MRMFKICWALIRHFGFWTNVEMYDIKKYISHDRKKTWMFTLIDDKVTKSLDISLFDRMKKAKLLREDLSVLDENSSIYSQPQPNVIAPITPVVGFDYPDVTEVTEVKKET